MGEMAYGRARARARGENPVATISPPAVLDDETGHLRAVIQFYLAHWTEDDGDVATLSWAYQKLAE